MSFSTQLYLSFSRNISISLYGIDKPWRGILSLFYLWYQVHSAIPAKRKLRQYLVSNPVGLMGTWRFCAQCFVVVFDPLWPFCQRYPCCFRLRQLFMAFSNYPPFRHCRKPEHRAPRTRLHGKAIDRPQIFDPGIYLCCVGKNFLQRRYHAADWTWATSPPEWRLLTSAGDYGGRRVYHSVWTLYAPV